MLHRYYGRYVNTGDLVAERGLEAEPNAWADKNGKPIITEYGAATVAGLHGVAPMPWTEDYRAELLKISHRVFGRVDAVVGEQIRNSADIAPGIFRVAGYNGGVFTRERRPWAGAHLLRRRWRLLSDPSTPRSAR
jgi:beta-glucuronidase